MATKISATEARGVLGELLARVGYGDERFVLERRGKPLAALISVDDLHRLESLESQEMAPSPKLVKEVTEQYVATQAVESGTEIGSQGPTGILADRDNAFASLAGIWQHLSDDDIRRMDQALLDMQQQTAARLTTLLQDADDD